MMKFLSVGLLLLSLVFIGTACSRGEPIRIALKLKKGDSYNITADNDTRMSRGTSIMKTNMKCGYAYGVEDVDPEGIARVKMKFVSIKTRSETPQGVFEFDSSKSPEDAPLELAPIQQLIGRALFFSLDSRGHVKDTRSVGPSEHPPGKAKTGGDPSGEFLQMEKYFEGMIKPVTDAFLVAYPEKPVRVGDTWDTTSQLSQPVPMTVESKTKFKKRENGSLWIGIASKMTSAAGGSPINIGGKTIRYEFSGSQKGELRLDESSGMFLKSDFAMEYSGKIKIRRKGEDGTLEIPVSGSGDGTLEAVKVVKADTDRNSTPHAPK